MNYGMSREQHDELDERTNHYRESAWLLKDSDEALISADGDELIPDFTDMHFRWYV